MHSKTRSSAIAVCTIASGASAISASRSVVALMPSSRPSSASSPASLPSLAAVDVHTPTSSRSGCASTPGDRVPADGARRPDDDAQRLLGDDLTHARRLEQVLVCAEGIAVGIPGLPVRQPQAAPDQAGSSTTHRVPE